MSTEPIRYYLGSINDQPEMVESPVGAYVHFYDYEALKADRDELRKEVKQLQDILISRMP